MALNPHTADIQGLEMSGFVFNLNSTIFYLRWNQMSEIDIILFAQF